MPSLPEGADEAEAESTLFRQLEGARLQRVDAPDPDLFAFTLHRRELHGVLVVALRPRLAWGWVGARPHGAPASAFVQQLRKHVEGGRVLSTRAHAGGATIELRRGGALARLHFVADAPDVVLEVDGVVVGAARDLRRHGLAVNEPWVAAPIGETMLCVDWLELTTAGPGLVERTMGAALDQERRRVLRAVRRQLKRRRRRLEAIAEDLARVDEVAGLRHRADLLLAHLHTIAAGAEEAVVTDWETGSERSIPIRSGRSARAEAEALYGRAGKLERGGRKAIERRALTEQEIERLDALAASLEVADEGALEELERAAQRLGVATRRTAVGPDKKPVARVPYRKFFGTAGRPILVGRSASDNDALTQSARAWDHWLHARGVRGSHVVIPLSRRETCPPELLIDAAHLAAYHSAASGEPIVDVQHCARRYVRKPKGIGVGAVLVERERVITLRLQGERLTRLLQTVER